MNGTPIITTDNLTRHFGDTVAVDGLSLEVYPGEVFGFLGHNGAGKTTTVRLLNGILTPTAGSARVLGHDPRTEGPALRRHTGVLTETPALDEKLNARENLSIYATLYDVPDAEIPARVAHLLGEFELEERADEPVGGYSRGMKQRLALARTLIHEPQLIFLDEPTSGLDPLATRHVHQRIEELSNDAGRTVFLCTHNLAEAQRLCDRVAVMEHGRMVAIGTPRELARELWKGVRLEIAIAPEQLAAARAALEGVPDLRDVAWNAHDATVTAWTPDREAIPSLVDLLVGAGVRLYGLSPQEPTLEDAYFAMHGEEVQR